MFNWPNLTFPRLWNRKFPPLTYHLISNFCNHLDLTQSTPDDTSFMLINFTIFCLLSGWTIDFTYFISNMTGNVQKHLWQTLHHKLNSNCWSLFSTFPWWKCNTQSLWKNFTWSLIMFGTFVLKNYCVLCRVSENSCLKKNRDFRFFDLWKSRFSVIFGFFTNIFFFFKKWTNLTFFDINIITNTERLISIFISTLS